MEDSSVVSADISHNQPSFGMWSARNRRLGDEVTIDVDGIMRNYCLLAISYPEPES